MAVYDVKAVVIGGGPSGMACGITLQRKGIENCVIDRAEFPRDKTCGGLVTSKTRKQLSMLLDCDEQALFPFFDSFTDKVTLYYKQNPIVSSVIDPKFCLVNRLDFDNNLVEVYKSLGGMLFEGQKKYDIDYNNRSITLSDGTMIRFQNIIFADGALSRAHKDFALEMNSDLCMEVFLEKNAIETSGIEVHSGYAGRGYLWVFSYADKIGVGLWTNSHKDNSHKDILIKFLRERGFNADNEKLRFLGAYLPMSVADQNKTPDNVIMIGDAGGFVDPIYGEGLYMALLSGRTAGEGMSDENPKQKFLNSMSQCFKMIESGRKAIKIIGSPLLQKIALNRIAGHKGFLQFYCARQISEYTYLHNDTKIVTDYMKSRS